MIPITLILGYALSFWAETTAAPSHGAAVVPTLRAGETLTRAPGTHVDNLNPMDWRISR